MRGICDRFSRDPDLWHVLPALANSKFQAKTEKVESVCRAAAVHSEKAGSIPAEAHEARILWDADKLAHLGPHEILTLLLNNLATDRIRSTYDDPAFPDRAVTIEALARVRLKRFARSESPAGKFYFQPSRQWAAERFEAQRAFYASLCGQLGIRP